MNYSFYKKQVELLLLILPYIFKEKCFALHGGTAINLIQYNLHRLSIDIDLTYLLINDRETALKSINEALFSIKINITKALRGIIVQHNDKELKLNISTKQANVKVEVNPIKRGCFLNPVSKILCVKAQEEFDSFFDVQMVEIGHLFGGKICAALDRQHPRDLFDIHNMLKTENFSEVIKTGFLFYLVSSNRPIVEMLFPHLKDQHNAFENQFIGMTEELFTYNDFESTRSSLIKIIHNSLNEKDKDFLMQLESGEPNWDIYNFQNFPAIKWKLQNIEVLRDKNPSKHRKLIDKLKLQLENI